MSDNSLLLEIPAPFRASASGLQVEEQALNGLARWAEHFEPLTVCAPVLPERLGAGSTTVWADASELLRTRPIRLEPLPWAFHPADYLRHRSRVRRRLQSLVERHRYLCFSGVGGMGAWANDAVDAARRQGRAYSLWFDSVIDKMPQEPAASMKRRAKQWVDRRYTRYRTRLAIRASALGLFHGKTVYDAYAPLCVAPALVHDIHLKPHDAIGDADLDAKLRAIRSRKTIRIGYAGRAHPIKAPLDWVQAVAGAVRLLGRDQVEAAWLGDGPMLEQARQRVEQEGLQDVIRFPGFVGDRNEVTRFVRELDVFVFCHLTPESPRCLLESLVSATPLLGYESAFARDLVGERGGALLVPIGDTRALTAHLCRLADDRDALAGLVGQAALSRPLYNDEAVFAHRSALIKDYLP